MQIIHAIRIQYLEVLAKYNLDINEALKIADSFIFKDEPTTQNSVKAEQPVMTRHEPVQHQVRQPKIDIRDTHPEEANKIEIADEQVEKLKQDSPTQPQRYEEMIKMTNIHAAAAPRDSGVRVVRPLNAARDSRGIAEAGGEIRNR